MADLVADVNGTKTLPKEEDEANSIATENKVESPKIESKEINTVVVTNKSSEDELVKDSPVIKVESPVKDNSVPDSSTEVVKSVVNDNNVPGSPAEVIESAVIEKNSSDSPSKEVESAVNEKSVPASPSKVVSPSPVKENNVSESLVETIESASADIVEKIVSNSPTKVQSPEKEKDVLDAPTKEVPTPVKDKDVPDSSAKDEVKSPLKETVVVNESSEVVEKEQTLNTKGEENEEETDVSPKGCKRKTLDSEAETEETSDKKAKLEESK